MQLTSVRAGLVLSLAALLSFILTYLLTGNARGTPQYLAQARFDGWGYTAIAAPDGSIRVQVNYDRASVADLYRYVETNRALARQLATDGQAELAVTVSFRRPLTIAEFQTWAAHAPLQIREYQIRLRDAQGRRWTLGGAPSGGILISPTDLQRHLIYLASRGATDVQGVIVAEGTVAASVYDRLAADPDVFLADVTRSAAAAHLLRTVRGLDPRRLEATVAPAFSWMEDLGLEHFR